jgi:hypothetical protein
MQGVVDLGDIASRIQTHSDFGARAFFVFKELYDGKTDITRNNSEFEAGFEEFLRFTSGDLRISIGFTLEKNVKFELEYGFNRDESFVPKGDFYTR